MRYGSILLMKQSRYYLIAILIIMVNAVSFDIALPNDIDHTLETKVEISLEEKKAKEQSGNDLIANISAFDFKDTYVFAGFYFTIPTVDQLYLNTIFKPPISLHS